MQTIFQRCLPVSDPSPIFVGSRKRLAALGWPSRITAKFRLALAVLVLCINQSAPRIAIGDHLADAYASVRPSVVEIRAGQFGSGELDHGSGVLISATGLVLTVAHVVQSAREIRVLFADSTVHTARVVAAEPQADLALLQLLSMPNAVAVAPIGNSDDLRVGDEIFAVASPIGLGDFLSSGRVGSRHQALALTPTLTLAEFILTDTYVGDGSSGAPMFNGRGEVVGIVSRALSPANNARTVGFVITSRTVKRYLLDRKSPWTGFGGAWLTGRIAAALNLPQRRGLLVEQVAAGTLATELGLRPGTVMSRIEGQSLLIGGDVILNIQGISLAASDGYERAMSALCELQPGDRVTVEVLRYGARETLSAVAPEMCAY